MTRIFIVAALAALASPAFAEDIVRFQSSACMAWLGDWSHEPQGECRISGSTARCTLGEPTAGYYTAAVTTQPDGSRLIDGTHAANAAVRMRVTCSAAGGCSLAGVWHEETGYLARCAVLTGGSL